MEDRKRKREAEPPRIRYHVDQIGRSFERILKEDSHEQLREVVRKKLSMPQTAYIKLEQVREGRLYDLEDDEDFEAFKAAAFAYASLDVRVSLSEDHSTEGAHEGVAPIFGHSAQLPSPDKELGKHRSKKLALADQSTQDDSLLFSPSADGDGDVSRSLLPPTASTTSASPKKKRKREFADSPDDGEEEIPKPKKKKKSMGKDTEVPGSAMPVEEELERPKKKHKKSKEKELETSFGEHRTPVTTVDSILAQSAISDVPNPKLKKEKGRKLPLIGADTTTGDPNDVPVSEEKQPKTKKKKVTVPKQDRHDGDEQPGEPNVSVGAASVSEPELSASRAKSSRTLSESHLPNPAESSATSKIQAFLSAFLKKPPPTSEEMVASYSNSDAGEQSEDYDEPEPERVAKEARKSVKVKSKKKRELEDVKSKTRGRMGEKAKSAVSATGEGEKKSRSKTKLGKSQLRESWIPEDDIAVPVLPPAPQSSPATPAQHSNVGTPPAPIVPSHVSPTRPKPYLPKSRPAPNPCPVCLSHPFHFQFQCPVIESGVDAMRKRIDELREEGEKETLVNELEVWVEKKETESKENAVPVVNSGSEASLLTPGPSHDLKGVFMSASGRTDSPLPAWTTIVPLESQPSEVTIESRDEGSSDESITRSGGESNAELDLESESDSELDSKPTPSTGRKADIEVNLEDVDLDALIRGPTLRTPAVVFRIADESDCEDQADDIGVLEEEEEEERPRRSKARAAQRSSSPEALEDDSDDCDKGSDPEVPVIPHEQPALAVDKSVPDRDNPRDGTDEDLGANNTREGDNGAERPTNLDRGSQPEGALDLALTTTVDASLPKDPPVVQEAIGVVEWSKDVANPTQAEMGKSASNALPTSTTKRRTWREDPLDSKASQPERQTTPSILPIALRTRSAPDSPGTVQSMKDRHGNLPLNPPTDSIGIDQDQLPSPVVLEPASDVEEDEVTEKPKRGKPRTPSQPEITTRSRSRTAPPRAASVAPTPTDQASSASQPGVKRRGPGRPPLSEAVKAERRAIKEAEKAAKVALRSVKSARKKSNVSGNPMDTPHEPEPRSVSASQEAPLASQWETLPSDTVTSSVISPSSPAVDQLIPSSPPDRDVDDPIEDTAPDATEETARNASAIPDDPAGTKSPISVTSTSRKHDEDDVEDIVGSPKMPPPKRRPLFLPGASQMTQPQTLPHFLAPQSDETTHEPVVNHQELSPTGSSSHTEPDDDSKTPKMPPIPRSQLPSKPAFPSLSQLSFDKFRPSFLLSGRVFSQTKQKEQVPPQPDEDSESEDDEESTDDEAQSHIPKGRRAGTGVVKKKSRGLLQA